ncbi:MAG: RidA family protein [Eubacteriales bacterium]|nr:RidA family protein [Eubacteriales bacterium]
MNSQSKQRSINDQSDFKAPEAIKTPAPEGLYTPVVSFGQGLAYCSGAGPYRADGSLVTGRMGAGASLIEAQEAAALCVEVLLARLEAELGSIDRIRRCVKMTVFVQATEDFKELTQVADGASALLRERLGAERGTPARSSIGVASLSDDYLCEIELLIEYNVES